MAINDSHQIIIFQTLRKMIGYLGIALPFLVYLGSWFDDAAPLRNSISAYYYTNSREILIAILVSKSLLLYLYKGYSKVDNQLTNIASLLALTIALFPTSSETNAPTHYLFAFISPQVTDVIHLVAASTYFFMVACITYFIFTKTGNDPVTPQKAYRNRLYHTCGIIMFASIFIMGLYKISPSHLQFSLQQFRPIYLFETLFLMAFGLSWIVKGGIMLKDGE